MVDITSPSFMRLSPERQAELLAITKKATRGGKVNPSGKSTIRKFMGTKKDLSVPKLVKKPVAAEPAPRKAKMLQFPFNVTDDHAQGHYILFTIYQPFASFLDGKKGKRAQIGDIWKDVGSPGAGGNYSLTSRMMKKGPPIQTVAMYMPATAQVTSDIKMSDQEIGAMTLETADVMNQVQQASGWWDTTVAGVSGIGRGVGELASVAMRTVAETFAPGAAIMTGMMTGAMRTPHMELTFSGVTRRTFSYTFSMTPRNAEETKEIDKIVKAFRVNMHPKFQDHSLATILGKTQFFGADDEVEEDTTQIAQVTRFMTFPSVFGVRYMYKGKDNRHLNKVKDCYLQKCDITFGDGDQWKAYVGGDAAPHKVTMALTFQEIEIMDRPQIAAGH